MSRKTKSVHRQPATAGLLVLALMASAATGCLSVKTENEIKPIHITMDINLKVDKAIDKAFADENMSKPKGKFKQVKDLLDRKVAGLNRQALLEAREGATDDDKILIAETNAGRVRRFEEIAKSSGVSRASVEKRSFNRFADKISAGSGVWIQGEDGTWCQK